MPESHLVAAVFNGGVVERAAAHIRAKAAGVCFLPYIENDFADVCRFDDIFHVEFFAKLLNGFHFFFVKPEPHIYRYRDDFVFFWIKPPHRR